MPKINVTYLYLNPLEATIMRKWIMKFNRDFMPGMLGILGFQGFAYFQTGDVSKLFWFAYFAFFVFFGMKYFTRISCVMNGWWQTRMPHGDMRERFHSSFFY